MKKGFAKKLITYATIGLMSMTPVYGNDLRLVAITSKPTERAMQDGYFGTRTVNSKSEGRQKRQEFSRSKLEKKVEEKNLIKGFYTDQDEPDTAYSIWTEKEFELGTTQKYKISIFSNKSEREKLGVSIYANFAAQRKNDGIEYKIKIYAHEDTKDNNGKSHEKFNKENGDIMHNGEKYKFIRETTSKEFKNESRNTIRGLGEEFKKKHDITGKPAGKELEEYNTYVMSNIPKFCTMKEGTIKKGRETHVGLVTLEAYKVQTRKK